jgi:hypothetical protein
MRSPIPQEVMDIGNIMNKKGGLVGQQHVAPAPELHHAQHLPHLSRMPDSPMDRAGSPHGSEHSRYSAPRSALDGFEGIPRTYPSPSAMHNSMHLPDPNMPHAMMLPAIPGMQHPMAPHGMMPDGQQAQSPVKAYPCSTCGKRFARRSDLARHGMSYGLFASKSGC